MRRAAVVCLGLPALVGLVPPLRLQLVLRDAMGAAERGFPYPSPNAEKTRFHSDNFSARNCDQYLAAICSIDVLRQLSRAHVYIPSATRRKSCSNARSSHSGPNAPAALHA